MIYNICGFYGYGNLGDEGILHAIIDNIREIDKSPAFHISTTLCSHARERYETALKTTLPEIQSIRDVYDTRSDYDVFILGGGNLNWGYGWRLALSAFASGKKSMNYGVGYAPHMGTPLYTAKLNGLYREFLNQFNNVTVRDEYSSGLLRGMKVEHKLTMCPGINLTTDPQQKLNDIENSVVVCPRYEDSTEKGVPVDNALQIDQIVSRILAVPTFTKITLLPLALNDLELCKAIQWDLPSKHESIIYQPTSPQAAKHAISKAKLVISGGRYHAVLWAIAHNTPYEITQSATRYDKVTDLIETHKTTPSEHLQTRERTNIKLLRGIING